MDPYLWLEEVESDTSLDWARERNADSAARLAGERFETIESEVLAILDSDERIPSVRRRGEWLWNYWIDGEHPYGLWRRTTLESYRTDSPEWDVVIDLDALREQDGENWVWGGAAVLRGESPDGAPWDRALVSRSRGGADATVVREFSISRREFLDPDAGGFALDEAKSRISWIDADSVYVGTDFGPGSLTDSGYPRVVKRWHRGTPLSEAVTVYEGAESDVSVGAVYDDTPGYERHFVGRSTDFYNHEEYLLDPGSGALELIDVPTDAEADVHHDLLLVSPKSPWQLPSGTVDPGALVAFDFDAYRAGGRTFTTIFAPDAHTSLQGYAWTKSYLLLATLHDVRSELRTLDPKDWSEVTTAGLPPLAEIGVAGTDPRESDEVFLSASSFTLPPSLLYGEAGGTVEPLKSTPAMYDADGVVAEQFFATSADGTQIPYFVVRKPANGPQPTLLYGYGGFEISLTPGYFAGAGRTWIERGGVYVRANIRGGGEYGPTWHTSALKENRMRCYEDFSAVARDLVERGITTRDQLGAMGGSNGGLLMGVMYTMYPELFGAIVCQVPLLDMKRFHLLLAGASWMAEYGDPDDPEQWKYISEYSPYQNLPDDAAGYRPALLVTTSTRDDRVHPGHARKFIAALRERGIDVNYYENIEGGHGGAADNKQAAFMAALAYEFLWKELS
ncbi:Prolyl oligopeptidase OS=Tsukamurella paurometabola (strain ATCC 8368 / DSM / CCUG 35730 / CIP 100753 / JCM 10117 / KCTC 9821 / NBRC 16120 / NCIMB 702349/ NCTC 13040) OX=521096 GN=Tpau_3675 PE=4 SV=1 [Tsukamurella paurometabola]|uniref:Prolyl oligopeptidase n=2 Tax=Tsukamurella paurometabola TaxID=2061 RepID=D5UY16_TSUPD|nr:Prolyl oligopeptidase [Tsukamurella paurometabola DSM 20162]SUP39019.1 Prolyl endopeptidase precursor [Tsukamurella paurometabola]